MWPASTPAPSFLAAPTARRDPSAESAIDRPAKSFAASPSTEPSRVQVEPVQSNTVTRPALAADASLPGAPTASRVPPADSATDQPDVSDGASPVMVSPS